MMRSSCPASEAPLSTTVFWQAEEDSVVRTSIVSVNSRSSCLEFFLTELPSKCTFEELFGATVDAHPETFLVEAAFPD